MSAGSPQRRVRKRTDGELAALRAKIMNRSVIAERNVVRADIMVALLDSIHDIIQTYHWGYLHNCACVVLTILVCLFYANLEVVQDDDYGLVIQSSVDVISLRLILRLSAISLGYPCSNSLPARTMR
jgi:hypothetical protein